MRLVLDFKKEDEKGKEVIVPQPSIQLLKMKYLNETPLRTVEELEGKFVTFPLE